MAPLDARTLLYVARAEDRSGPWLWALDVESKVDAAGDLGPRALHVGVSQSRRPARRRHRRQADRQPVARAAARSARRGSRRAAVPAADARGRWRRASAGRRCSICPPAARATGCGGSRTDRRPKSGRARTGRCPSRPPCRRTDSRVAVVVRQEGKRHLRSCRRTAPTHGRWRRPSRSKGGGQGAPTGRRTARGS